MFVQQPIRNRMTQMFRPIMDIKFCNEEYGKDMEDILDDKLLSKKRDETERKRMT